MGTLAATAGMAGLAGPLFANHITPSSNETTGKGEADLWFKKVKGSHRIVLDASEPHGGFPFIWAWAYYLTNNQTGTPDEDMTGVVVMRHNAMPFALKDEMWQKYNLGEHFHITDNLSQGPARRNTYYDPQEGDFPIPGIDGIKTMQNRGAMFCVCDLALTVYSGMIAQQMELKPEDVKNDWLTGIHPGIQVVPSGVWALGRAQEKGCGYIYAGG